MARGAVHTDWTRLVLDRTPAGYVTLLSENTRTSKQPVEEGGQKKKKNTERVSALEKEREEARTVVEPELCGAAVDRKRSLTLGDAD